MSQHWGITAFFLASVQGDRGAGLIASLSAEKWKCNIAKKPDFINDKAENILSEWHHGFDK